MRWHDCLEPQGSLLLLAFTCTCTHVHRATYMTKCICIILKWKKNKLFLEEVYLGTGFQKCLSMLIWVHCFGACYQATLTVSVCDEEKHFLSHGQNAKWQKTKRLWFYQPLRAQPPGTRKTPLGPPSMGVQANVCGPHVAKDGYEFYLPTSQELTQSTMSFEPHCLGLSPDLCRWQLSRNQRAGHTLNHGQHTQVHTPWHTLNHVTFTYTCKLIFKRKVKSEASK